MRLAAERTLVMGILNVTPDSFSGDGLWRRPEAAVERALQLQAAGADIIDVGGESTRPGAISVPVEEELQRVVPVLAGLQGRLQVPMSIDTRRGPVARRALALGATLVNDVSGGADPDLLAAVAASSAALAVVHNTRPGEGDVVQSVVDGLAERVERAMAAGVPRDRLVIDPGLGFGKGARQNLELVRRLRELSVLRLPILVGPSRKGTIGRVLGGSPDDRLEGTIALVTACIAGGADIVRVHDVAAMVKVVRMTDALVGRGAILRAD